MGQPTTRIYLNRSKFGEGQTIPPIGGSDIYGPKINGPKINDMAPQPSVLNPVNQTSPLSPTNILRNQGLSGNSPLGRSQEMGYQNSLRHGMRPKLNTFYGAAKVGTISPVDNSLRSLAVGLNKGQTSPDMAQNSQISKGLQLFYGPTANRNVYRSPQQNLNPASNPDALGNQNFHETKIINGTKSKHKADMAKASQNDTINYLAQIKQLRQNPPIYYSPSDIDQKHQLISDIRNQYGGENQITQNLLYRLDPNMVPRPQNKLSYLQLRTPGVHQRFQENAHHWENLAGREEAYYETRDEKLDANVDQISKLNNSMAWNNRADFYRKQKEETASKIPPFLLRKHDVSDNIDKVVETSTDLAAYPGLPHPKDSPEGVELENYYRDGPIIHNTKKAMDAAVEFTSIVPQRVGAKLIATPIGKALSKSWSAFKKARDIYDITDSLKQDERAFFEGLYKNNGVDSSNPLTVQDFHRKNQHLISDFYRDKYRNIAGEQLIDFGKGKIVEKAAKVTGMSNVEEQLLDKTLGIGKNQIIEQLQRGSNQ
ncbi:MAG: hypothetical protein R3261_03470 [Alphaproteobacteria bacterium]|nr:hypothetical protein [Alphaproteobacteria bacterium]